MNSNKTFARMQKLAGIITENQSNSLLNLINDYVDYTITADLGSGMVTVNGTEIPQTKYAELQKEKIKSEIIKLKGEQFFEDLDDFASLKLSSDEYAGEDLTGELEAAVSKLGFSLEDLENNLGENKKSYYKDAEKDDAAHIDALEKDMKDDAKHTSEGKMTKSELKAKIKEMILAELNEDSDEDINITDADSAYDPLAEAEEEDEDYEDLDLDVEFQKAPNEASYNDVLDIMKSYEDESILNDFKAEFPEGKPVNKKDYSDFAMTLIDDMSEVSFIQANWISIFDEDIYDKAGLTEAKKDKEEVEDVTVDDTEVVDAPASDMMAGESAEISGIQSNLQAAYAEAKALGDEKLITQIANTITYFTKAHILDTAPVNESMFPMLKRIIK